MVAGPCEVAQAARDCQEEKNIRCQTDSIKSVKNLVLLFKEKSERT